MASCLWARDSINPFYSSHSHCHLQRRLLDCRGAKRVADETPHNTAAPGSVPPTLPPSVEAAYKLKCIALKKRMAELDEYNDATRQRIVRNTRAIRKMRLERAFLLKAIGEIAEKKGLIIDGFADQDSDASSDGPPTVNTFSHPRTPIVGKHTHYPSSLTKNHFAPNAATVVPFPLRLPVSARQAPRLPLTTNIMDTKPHPSPLSIITNPTPAPPSSQNPNP